MKNLKINFSKPLFVLGILSLLFSCAEVGLDNQDFDLIEDNTEPLSSFRLIDQGEFKFDCNNELSLSNYYLELRGGTKKAVNATQFSWKITPSENIKLLNSDSIFFEDRIKNERKEAVELEEEIIELRGSLICETDVVEIAEINAKILEKEAAIVIADENLSNDAKELITFFEDKISKLPSASLNDRVLVASLPSEGDYEVELTVTDELGKSNTIVRPFTFTTPEPPSLDEVVAPEIENPSFTKSPRGWTGWDPDNVNGTTLDVGRRPGESGNSADGDGASLKFNPAQNRVVVQVIDGFVVGQEYRLVYNYSIKSDSGTTKLRVLVIPGAIDNASQIDPNGPGVFFKLGETSLNSSSRFTQESIQFTAQNTELTIYFSGTTGDGATDINGDSDLRLDNISLQVIQ